MGPMTREMFYFFNLMGWCYWICGDKFTVELGGEEYVFKRQGLRCWTCKKEASTTEFRSQHEVMEWLELRS